MAEDVEVWPGSAFPFGAVYDGNGTNFALFSEVAEAVELCLFDESGGERRTRLEEVDGHCWHAYLPSVAPGQRYGYRVHGPWSPSAGLRCNPAKLLLDPYAKAIDGHVDWSPACFGHELGDEKTANGADSAPHVPKSVVDNPFFDWDNDRPPRTPLHESVVYEVHVKGFTALHPEIPEGLRGRYAGLAHPVAVDYLRELGVTAVELLPVQQFVHDAHLVERGLRNYWGYNSIGFFAPHNDYASGGDGAQVREFKAMVRTLHNAGIEVILDVVYNHTAEGNHLGPMLSFKGIDNHAYYRTVAEDPGHYYDTTGTGNSLNVRHPRSLQMIMDSLRYWVTEMHVDGFRFDLAATLARQFHEVDRLSAFFDLIQQDPVVSRVKLIAEPWDVGDGGYQVGNFPALWSEWNGKYRDSVRDFWRSEEATLPELGSRLMGSSDLYQADSRHPVASVNFVTAHDGFTLADLVSYNDPHNEANGEGDADGERHNRSWNCGHEGPTRDPAVLGLRARQRRNILTTLFLSQGVPMLLGGDEIGRTQHGNNNGYCQDNEVSWFDWTNADSEMLDFARRLIATRRLHPVLRSRRWFEHRPGSGAASASWHRPDGEEMTGPDWETGSARAIGLYLNGGAVPGTDARGQPIVDDSFFLVLNAGSEAIDWILPADLAKTWSVVVDTARTDAAGSEVDLSRPVCVEGRTVLVLVAPREP